MKTEIHSTKKMRIADMFLRKMGRRFLLLHSQRMGDGRVLQRRLGHFEQAAELRQSLGCARWREEFQKKNPGVSVDWRRLHEQAQHLPEDPPRTGREQRIALLKRNLLSLLQEESHEGIRGFIRELERQTLDCRSALPARRRRFEASEPRASDYFSALREQAEQLKAEGRLDESATVLQEWVGASASPEARLAYGGVLQLLGRSEEARQQFACLPRGDFRRHYQLAALACQQRQPDQALVHLLQGLLLNRSVGEALTARGAKSQAGQGREYWQRYGDLWDEWSRRFFLDVYSQRPVRMLLSLLIGRGVHVHEVLPERTRQRLLQRILEPQLAVASGTD